MAYCDRCERYFSSYRALEQHIEDSSRHHVCDDCDKDFTTEESLQQHWVQSPLHFYCQRCDEHFDDDDELEEHLEDVHWYCSDCNRVCTAIWMSHAALICLFVKLFASEDGLHQHNRQKHWYCESCRRLFQNENNLNTHLRSSIHQPRRLRCPGRSCNASFVSAAHLVAHCESGACPSGVTRKAVDRLVASIDRGNIITNPGRMVESSDSFVTQTWATSRSWNGDAYECFLCHKEFKLLSALNQHLQSPAHQDNQYRCPPAWNGCRAQFKTLSGLMQHVESESCDVERFKRRFTKVINDVTKGIKMLSF